MFLVDTNIFLEILLGQENKDKCKDFLNKNIGRLYISDFSFHTIGVILFKYEKENIFKDFIEDITPYTNLLTLPIEQYKGIVDIKMSLNLDFDDAYQYAIAKHYGLKIVTMDKDFKKVKDLEISFI